ncbi:MAG: hypothetical protein MK102_17125 [Fuerstiella sp.]|nr:hypothetical protein [Fuerstiella sp.]
MTIRDNMVVTIVTASFLHYARALRSAFEELNAGTGFLAIVIDPTPGTSLPEWAIGPQTLCEEQPRAQQLIEHYRETDRGDAFRWSLKSQLLLYCIRHGAKKVLWCDPDLMFFEDPKPLFDMIEPDTVLLSPHFRAFRPSTNEVEFQKNFTEGIFQAGFLGVGQDTNEFLDWWAEACLWDMSKNPVLGTYVDQKFLDLLPVYWSGTKILKNRGCNIGEWNWHENKRVVSNANTLINGEDSVMFVHFTDWTIAEILHGRDTSLRPYLERYVRLIRRYDSSFQPRVPARFTPGRP